MKKLYCISVLLVFATLTSAKAYNFGPEDSDYPYEMEHSGTCGENLTWTLSADSVLTVSGSGEMNAVPWEAYCQQIKTVQVLDGITNVGPYAFANCTNLTSVTLGENVRRIEHNAFEFCEKLTSIDLHTVTEIGHNAFDQCWNLKTVIFGDSLREIDHQAFRNCDMVTLELPNTITSIGWGAFRGCINLTSIHFPTNLTGIEHDTFRGCNFTTLTIPESITYIDDNAFAGCPKLNAINIPESVTYIGSYAFDRCPKLNAINIPETVTSIGECAFRGTAWYESQPNGLVYVGPVAYCYKGKLEQKTSLQIKDGAISVSPYAFYGLYNLTAVTIPGSVTQIGHMAFEECSDLTTVYLPQSLQTIGYSAFYNCKSMTDIYIDAVNPPSCESKILLMNGTIETRNNLYQTVMLHVPVGTIQAYQTAEEWNSFTHIQEFDPTEISGIQVEEAAPSAIYDLQGRQLQQKPSKGMYIQGGKKVLVK